MILLYAPKIHSFPEKHKNERNVKKFPNIRTSRVSREVACGLTEAKNKLLFWTFCPKEKKGLPEGNPFLRRRKYERNPEP